MLLHDNRKANALCYHKSERSCVDSKNLQSPRNFHAHNYDAAQLISLILDEDVMCSLIPSRVISNFRKLADLEGSHALEGDHCHEMQSTLGILRE